MTTPDVSSSTYWISAIFQSLSQNFARSEPRTRAWNYLYNLVETPQDENQACRRNLACRPDDRRPDSAQRLLTTARWDEQRVRRELLDFIARRCERQKCTFYVLETAFVKKGNKTVALSHQFSVDTGRRENCQISVMLFCGTADGNRFLVDCDLYVPRECVEVPDGERMIPNGTVYRSKSQIAVSLLENAMRRGLVPDRVLVSLMCPDKTTVQRMLRARRIPHYMPLTSLDLARNETAAPAGRVGDARPDVTVAQGARPRVGRAALPDQVAGRYGYYYVYDPSPITFQDVTGAAAELKRMRQAWSSARECVRFDRYSVRSMLGWHRHMSLAMIALTGWELARTYSGPAAGRTDSLPPHGQGFAARRPVPVR